MNDYEIKKVLSVDNNLSFEECEEILVSEDTCLGVLDENRETTSYVLKEDLIRALKFNISNHPINLIATLADVIDINIDNPDESEIKQHIRPGLNKGVFIGKNRKEITHLVVCQNLCADKKEIFLLNEYENNIPNKIKNALELCSKAADKISLSLYIIGGVVRDIIIGKQSFDVDITVEENAIEFSRFLRKQYPDIVKIKEIHEDFKTAKVIFNIENENIELDIASTRKEKYPYPAGLPQVDQIGCDMKEDISRRDFTINSMALSLNQANFCKLIDPLDGYNDIKGETIRILHPISFVDDPTRIIRALKFSIRFNYELEKATEYLAQTCLESELFDNLGGERIKSEIKQTFNLNKPKGLVRFVNERSYYLIDKTIQPPESIKELSFKCREIISKYEKHIGSPDLIWLIYLGILINTSSKDEIAQIAVKLYLSGMETEILIGAKNLQNNINQLKPIQTRFEIYEQLEDYFSESILIALIINEDKDIEEKIYLYLNELQYIKIHTTGKDLIKTGLTPGPLFGEILRELLQAKINKEINTPEEEQEYIKKFIPQKRK
ncbi:MAG: hypothetical protein ACD_20C00330G0013 [uncultured bacterium]|nr:MAG: hypothetical protein ACD_20C00330G0013 [uncultured bacterium]